MSLRETIKSFINNYFIIYTGSMLGTYVFCSIFQPDAVFDLNYFAWILLFALVGDLPIFVFCSNHELTEKELAVRFAFHLILLETVLLFTAHLLGMYSTLKEGIIFALIILGVYVMVKIVGYGFSFRTANKINRRLMEIAGCEKESEEPDIEVEK